MQTEPTFSRGSEAMRRERHVSVGQAERHRPLWFAATLVLADLCMQSVFDKKKIFFLGTLAK